jgi:dihydroflavonol-4-reductase
MDNILVTGANGHVGYNITKLLAERGYNVRASVRDINNINKTNLILPRKTVIEVKPLC